MLKMKNNLKNVILKYFLLFSLLILGLLWILQFVFFKTLYKEQKINDIKTVANEIKKLQNTNNYKDTLNYLALDKSVCIEIDNSNYYSLYDSTYFGKGCINDIPTTYKYKVDFIENNKEKEVYTIRNQTFKNETIVYAVKLKDNNYAFINASVEPVDGTLLLLSKELLIITILILILSFALAYFISEHISNPIKQMNHSAKKLATGNFDVEFNENSKILEIEELSKTLNYTKNELSKIEELRRDLMANISHDLKTPLTMIKANAEIAKDLHLNNKEKQIEDMTTIISETDRLTILVNDILELSKMESIKEDLTKTKFNLIELIENIIERYKVLQETEKYKFKFIHKEKEILINADKKKIEQVIYNLVNNAINYTGKDNLVTIKVTTENNILVEIRDTGKGIKESELPYIWEKYYKNEKKHKRNLIGTGLGLNIVKNILEQHQYKYGVNSKVGKGTTFYFIIPEEK